jgi:O-methyltransferase involved in polyketide biosynthesis
MQKLDAVGSTSLWVAAGRAIETERADALFRDPFARELAGEEGIASFRQSEQSRGPRAQAASTRQAVVAD